MDALGRERRVDDLGALLPEVLMAGSADGSAYLLVRALPGQPATPFAANEPDRSEIISRAASVALRLHTLTASARVVEADLRTAWVRGPAAQIESLLEARDHRRLGDLVGDTIANLPDRAMVGWIHGDFWTENLLVDPASRRLTGIVDWDSADPSALGHHDLFHLVLYDRKKRNRTEIGAEICRAAGPAPAWDAVEGPIIERAVELIGSAGSSEAQRTATALYWLRLVSVNLERQPFLRRRRAWVDDNVRQVIRCL